MCIRDRCDVVVRARGRRDARYRGRLPVFSAVLLGNGDGAAFGLSLIHILPRPRALGDGDAERYTATVTILGQLRKEVPALTDAWVAQNIEDASTALEFRVAVARGLEAEAAVLNRDAHARLANIELEKRLRGTIPDAFYQASREGLRLSLIHI